MTNHSLYSSLLTLLAGLLPTYLIRFSVFGLPTNFFEVVVVVTFLLGAFQPDVRHSWTTAARTFPRPLVISIFLFLISAVASTAVSPHLETSAGILKGWIVIPMVFGWMMYASSAVGGATGVPRQARNSSEHLVGVRALILSGLVVALLGVSQLGTLDRIRGPYDVPNSLALFLAPLIVLAVFQRSHFSKLAAATMFIALLFTQSVAGVLTVLVALGLFLCFGYWKLKPVWALCFGACVFLALPILIPKINYLLQPTSSAAVRLQLWSISWDLIREHPLLGIGLGTFEPAYQEKLHERFARPASAGQPAPLAEFVFRDPHNWILSFWLNTGLLGLVSFSFLNGYALWRSRIRSPVSLALLTLLIFGLMDTIFWKNDLAALHWSLIALALTTPAALALSPVRRTEG